MTRPWSVVAVLAVGLLACDEPASPSGKGTGGLTLQVAAGSATLPLDSGYVRLTGPSSRVVKVVPGQSVTIDALQPGDYTVALEGFEGANFSHYTKGAATVVKGQTASASIPAMARVHLGFAVQPTTIGLGRSIAPSVVVNLLDGANAVIASPSANNTIGLAISTNPSGAAFVTAQTVAAINGVATFSGVALNEAGAGYTLAANGNSLTGAVSTPFNVTNRAIVTHNVVAGLVSIVETSTRTKVGASISVGSAPYDEPAFTADGAFAYIPNYSSANVSVISMATAAVVATVPVGTNPYGVAFGVTSLGPRIYAPAFTSANVSVINPATNTVVTTVPVGAGAIRVGFTPDGTKAFVSNFSASTVSVISTATNTVVATPVVGAGPQGIVVNPAGTFAYVANSQGSSVMLINTATYTVGPPIAVGSFPVGIVVHPSGQFVYVVNQSTPSISVITAATSAVTATMALPSGRNLAISPSGRFLYVPGAGNVYVFSTATNTLVDSIAVGTNAIGAAFQPKP